MLFLGIKMFSPLSGLIWCLQDNIGTRETNGVAVYNDTVCYYKLIHVKYVDW